VTKAEVLKKINALYGSIEDIIQSVDNLKEDLKAVKLELDDFPDEESEITDDEKDDDK
jgi:hypothetical protein